MSRRHPAADASPCPLRSCRRVPAPHAEPGETQTVTLYAHEGRRRRLRQQRPRPRAGIDSRVRRRQLVRQYEAVVRGSGARSTVPAGLPPAGRCGRGHEDPRTPTPRSDIRRPLGAIATPALTVDRAVLLSNLAMMRGRLDTLGVGLRPHIKVQKCPQFARLQVEYGALGVACATACEANAMASRPAHARPVIVKPRSHAAQAPHQGHAAKPTCASVVLSSAVPGCIAGTISSSWMGATSFQGGQRPPRVPNRAAAASRLHLSQP
jgi:hypothetical protein